MENYVDIIRSELYQHGYRFIKFLGKGAYAKVVLAEIMPDKLELYKADADQTGNACVRSVAIKVLNKHEVSQYFLDVYLPRELQNHSSLHSHQHVVRIYETMQTQENAYIVMDYCPNGDLINLLHEHKKGDHKGIGESEAKKLFEQLCQAVHHMHSAGIVHRDLKLENILLDKDHAIQLTDFGFSRHCDEMNPMMKTRCGTFSYTAPEVTSGKSYNGFKCDIWSLGVTLFALVNGHLPYNHSQLTKMDEDMQMQRLKFRQNVSSGFITLIRKLLQFTPHNRPSIQEVLEDPWLIGKQPIPRQKLSRPKWETQCAPKVPEAPPKTSANTAAGRTPDRKSHCVSKKWTGSSKPKTAIGTVSLNRGAGETVTLKSPLHCNKPKHPYKMSPTIKPRGTTSSRPVQADRTGQRAKTRQNMDANDVVQAVMGRTLQLENRHLANDARVAEMKQVPFWLMKEVLDSHQDNLYERSSKPEAIPAVPKQPITRGAGFTVQRKKSNEVSTVGKDTVSKSPQAPPKDKQQQQVHPLPTKPKVSHPPPKDVAQHPEANGNVHYQLPKLGVRHPQARPNVRAQPPKPSVRHLHFKSNVPHQPPQHSVQQPSSTPCVPYPPATSRPEINHLRRVVFLNDDKKLSPGLSKTHNMTRGAKEIHEFVEEGIIQRCRKDSHAVTNRRRPEFQPERNQLKQRTTNQRP